MPAGAIDDMTVALNRMTPFEKLEASSEVVAEVSNIDIE